ncbi:hypothetical protein B0H12DRAFT_1322638 [Mycena haematopus]|nr:hypothetical protein B0H12DRAFT_1322638 [Mycena haematopus]
MSSNGLDSYVDRLATEIWGICWNYCGVPDLRRLCLVCKYFCTICQPPLFRRQTILAPFDVNRSNWIKLTEKMHNRAVALHGLAPSPLAAFVREWDFMGNDALNHNAIQQSLPFIVNIHILQGTWRRVLTLFTTTLGAYQRLTVLRLAHLPIDATVRTAIESLEFLEELKLSECDIVARIGNLLPLKIFTLNGMRGSQARSLHLVAPHNLHRLTVGNHVDAEPIFKALSCDLLPRLARISITMSACFFECFLPFLARCSQLESIHIRPYRSDRSGPTSLPDPLPITILPALKSFSGPFFLAGRFVQNRPVEHVQLNHSRMEIAAETVLSTLSAVSMGIVSLRSLSIGPAFPVEASPEIFEAVGTYFPHLRSLTLELVDQDPDLSDVNGEEEEQEEEASDAEDEIDTRIVELPEGTIPVPSVAQADKEFLPVLPNKKTKAPRESLPPNLLPGHLYDHGGVYTPDPERVELDDESSPVATVMDLIHAGRIVLPPQLEVLHFTQHPSWAGKSDFGTDEQHQAILSLEAFVPTLREIAFSDHQDCWLRDRHAWSADRLAGLE